MVGNWGPDGFISPKIRPPMEVPKFIDVMFQPWFKDKDYLYQKYVVEGLSTKEIAKVIMSSHSTILKYLKLFKIPVRPHDEACKKTVQIGYGKKWKGRELINHKREQDLIKKIKKLRDEGLSYWKIADVFNAWGIPTKTRRGKWHAKTIQQILRGTEDS